MPRKPVKSYTEILKVLKKKPIFFDNKKLKKKNHKEGNYEVWSDARLELLPIEKHNLYMYVYDNRKGIKDELRKHHFPETVSSNQSSESKQPKNDSTDTPYHDASNNGQDLDLHEKQVKVIEDCDDFDSIMEMKIGVSYFNKIQTFGLDPFFLVIHSPDQMSIYKNLVKNDAFMCITILPNVIPGVKVKSHCAKNNSIISICSWYQGDVVYIANFICELLNPGATSRFIENFLSSNDNVPLPKRLIVEYNICILDDICLLLNECSFIKYIM